MNIKEMSADAFMAVKWVQKSMPRGAANIAQMGQQEDTDDVVNRVETSRAVMGQIAAMLADEEQISAKLTLLQSSLSENLEAGNCHEQASAAFLYLQRKGIKEVQLLRISMQPYRNDIHVFVALSEENLDGTGFQSWKDDKVIVCDPWMAEMATKGGNHRYTSGVYAPKAWGRYLDGAGISDPSQHNVVRMVVVCA